MDFKEENQIGWILEIMQACYNAPKGKKIFIGKYKDILHNCTCIGATGGGAKGRTPPFDKFLISTYACLEK